MRKLLTAAALCLAWALILPLSGCGAGVEGRSFHPTSNMGDETVAHGEEGTSPLPPVGFEKGSSEGSTQIPSGSGSGSPQIPFTGAGSGSTQLPSTGPGSGPTPPPSSGTGSGSTQPSTSSGGTTIEVDPVLGTAALAWTAPTTRVDGSPLTDLAGYAVEYGRSSGALDQLITVNDASATTYTVQGLESGVWYFSVRALAVSGTQSDYSNIAATRIQ